ncbi:hypothetical protein ACA29_23400 [Lederbergia galactosidilytica]|uniref:Uncharacterized protein n=1 Tax=Lederbergia galactosidilytica TaxID=217031 RepID=A0A0Q9XZD9_9BACI|nr:hypothetical protein ACA29_23400 [Lederbergia galactosidilytica]
MDEIEARVGASLSYNQIHCVDWTVFVYFVLPATVISVFVYFVLPATVISFFIYRSWWLEMPNWMDGVPIQLLALFFLLLWGDHFHTYVREADRIFLRKNKKLFLQLKQWGIIYSYLYQCLSVLGVGIAIGPFWYQHFQLHTGDFILFSGLWVSLKWLIMAIKGKWNVQVRGWRSLLRGIPFFIGALIVWGTWFSVFFTAECWLAFTANRIQHRPLNFVCTSSIYFSSQF